MTIPFKKYVLLFLSYDRLVGMSVHLLFSVDRSRSIRLSVRRICTEKELQYIGSYWKLQGNPFDMVFASPPFSPLSGKTNPHSQKFLISTWTNLKCPNSLHYAAKQVPMAEKKL